MADPAETEMMRQYLAQGPMPQRVPRPGDPGLPAQAPGEMRSANSPLGDILSQYFGSTAVGPAVGAVEKFGKATGDAAAGMTGAPWAVQTGDQLAEALARGGSGLPEIAPSAQAEEPSGGVDRLTRLQTQMDKLINDRNIATRARDDQLRGKGGAKAGEGPQYTAKNNEVLSLDSQIKGLQKSIEFEQNMLDPNFQREQRRLEQVAADQRQKELSEMPFRQKYAAWANALPNYGIAASIAIPGAMGIAKNARTFWPGSPTGRMHGAIDENLLARTMGDQGAEELSRAELKNLLAGQTGVKGTAKELGKGLLAAGSGGALAAEASMYPDQYDALNLPEGPTQEKARDRALNPMNYIERAGIGTLTGGSAYKTAHELSPRRPVPTAKAQAIVDNPPSNGPPPIPLNAAPAPQLPPPPGGGQAAQPNVRPDGRPHLPAGMEYDVNGVPYDIHTGYKIPAKYFKPRT